MDFIYISNTRVPSEKANTYQSFVMCEALANMNTKVEFWYPDMRNTENMEKIVDAYEYYNVSKNFKIKKLYCFDNTLMFKYLTSFWFLFKSLSFGLKYSLSLRSLKNSTKVLSRDVIGLIFLSFFKKIKFIRQNVYFEAHTYSQRISSYAKNMDGLIVINSHLKELYKKDGIKNILVAHDGVKIETFKELDIESAKNVLKLEKKYSYITYIGRFNTMGEEKGIPEIIESFKYIKNENIKLLFVGGPLDDIDKYYNLCEEIGIDKELLIFIDRQPVYELYKYIGASNILLMPFPWTEHYAYYMSPLKMFEYMASKRVIIGSKLPSIKEVLQDNKNAILCEPNNPIDLANKIDWVLNNDCNELINKAFIDVEKNYTWDKRAKKIIDWINND